MRETTEPRIWVISRESKSLWGWRFVIRWILKIPVMGLVGSASVLFTKETWVPYERESFCDWPVTSGVHFCVYCHGEMPFCYGICCLKIPNRESLPIHLL
ncbi:hypothetical protein BDP55DRAFT_312426 [Colletotrichum godetiae]|uniref:Uncharacterized protein n=1 Tax=Colletotrichum godetiae TaxID=1209918 RepID=A0AAJ0AV18_9PEZI|nr:uncharacterized protein BDP55DRAFT_312426 [Colletotrichum godetiae]KAK1690903.1 hypothetical protein BDP55DRAFT_312426 [Colletotrichum godetiae]